MVSLPTSAFSMRAGSGVLCVTSACGRGPPSAQRPSVHPARCHRRMRRVSFGSGANGEVCRPDQPGLLRVLSVSCPFRSRSAGAGSKFLSRKPACRTAYQVEGACPVETRREDTMITLLLPAAGTAVQVISFIRNELRARARPVRPAGALAAETVLQITQSDGSVWRISIPSQELLSGDPRGRRS